MPALTWVNYSTIALICIVFIAVLAYGQFLRPGLAASQGNNLMIVEWLALLTVLAVAGYRIWSFAKKISETGSSAICRPWSRRSATTGNTWRPHRRPSTASWKRGARGADRLPDEGDAGQ